MKKNHNKYITFFACLSVALAVAGYYLVLSKSSAPGDDIKQQTFAALDAIKNDKRAEITRHFNEMGKNAHAIKDDKVMRNAFKSLISGRKESQLEYAVDERYAHRYGDFYDILFVDSSGYVFHSIKKERDYHSNLFTSPMANNELAQALKRPDEEHFVEFNYYRPSNEPAAFFTVSLQERGQHIGWFVLQMSTNSTNQILTKNHDFGRSSEVYLVNRNSLMLSNSRFIDDSTILRQKVDTLAVKAALDDNSGDRIIEDYRGVRVFSSFEKFDVLGVPWVIIAEIDEDEVLTEFYKNHKKYFQKEFVRYLAQTSRHEVETQPEELSRQRVDMNEFAKAEKGKTLATYGVASCTAVAVYYPGKFSYLAHVSPTDEIYQDSALSKLFLGRHYHNFLGELLARIEFFDLVPAQRRNLKVAIIAPHTQSFAKAVDAVLSHDLDLANITVLCDLDALQGDVYVDASGTRLEVRWKEKNRLLAEDGLKRENLAQILKKIIRYDV
ncbi:MAG: cache domain-containing protein [Desulfobulbaceae bacterium]|nr:cache domain-containing protein [Desulfobulbaceae bacterium]